MFDADVTFELILVSNGEVSFGLLSVSVVDFKLTLAFGIDCMFDADVTFELILVGNGEVVFGFIGIVVVDDGFGLLIISVEEGNDRSFVFICNCNGNVGFVVDVTFESGPTFMSLSTSILSMLS